MIPVCVGAESQLTEAWTPATISKRGCFAATAKQKEGFISQHVSIFLQQGVCVSLWACVSAKKFQLLVFSCITLVVYME